MSNLVKKIVPAKSFPKEKAAKIIWFNSPIKNQTLKIWRTTINGKYHYQFCGFDLDKSSLHGIQSEKNVMHKLKQLVHAQPQLFTDWEISGYFFNYEQTTPLNQDPTTIYQNFINIAKKYHQTQKVRS